MPTVQSLFYQEIGKGDSGPALVLVHGAGCGHAVWDELGHRLGKRRRVLAVDLPGHGRTPDDGRPPSIEGYARNVVDMLDSLGLGQAILAGHSMGGAVVETVALDFPGRVAALVLVGTGARLRVAAQVLDVIRDHFDRYPEMAAEWGYSPATARDDARHWVRLDLQAEAARVLGDFAACDRFDVRHRLNAVRAPTLVICGSDDFLTPPRFSELLAQTIPGAELRLIERAGHFVMHERPDEVAEAMLGFLDRKVGGGR
jgi:pimeloyl-ACP methyl ester carboxylesterase